MIPDSDSILQLLVWACAIMQIVNRKRYSWGPCFFTKETVTAIHKKGFYIAPNRNIDILKYIKLFAGFKDKPKIVDGLA